MFSYFDEFGFLAVVHEVEDAVQRAKEDHVALVGAAALIEEQNGFGLFQRESALLLEGLGRRLMQRFRRRRHLHTAHNSNVPLLHLNFENDEGARGAPDCNLLPVLSRDGLRFLRHLESFASLGEGGSDLDRRVVERLYRKRLEQIVSDGLGVQFSELHLRSF